MTLDEAREHIGDKVIYRIPESIRTDEGVITSVNHRFVFVRYGSDYGSQATTPERPRLLVPGCDHLDIDTRAKRCRDCDQPVTDEQADYADELPLRAAVRGQVTVDGN